MPNVKKVMFLCARDWAQSLKLFFWSFPPQKIHNLTPRFGGYLWGHVVMVLHLCWRRAPMAKEDSNLVDFHLTFFETSLFWWPATSISCSDVHVRKEYSGPARLNFLAWDFPEAGIERGLFFLSSYAPFETTFKAYKNVLTHMKIDTIFESRWRGSRKKAIVVPTCGCGGMVDTPDLGSGDASRGGSSPFTRTTKSGYIERIWGCWWKRKRFWMIS